MDTAILIPRGFFDFTYIDLQYAPGCLFTWEVPACINLDGWDYDEFAECVGEVGILLKLLKDDHAKWGNKNHDCPKADDADKHKSFAEANLDFPKRPDGQNNNNNINKYKIFNIWA